MKSVRFFYQKMDTFDETYRCYSAALLPSRIERCELLYGGKIVLPQSALRVLTELDLNWPLVFQLTNDAGEEARSTHCGVLEFTAEEGRVYLPQWMMQTLLLDEGDLVDITSVELLPVGTFAKFQPQHVDFLAIDDPKAALENAMRNFSTLTEGDVLTFIHLGKLYDIRVLETKPEGGVTIMNTDLEVDFAPPVGYVEPVHIPPSPQLGRDLDQYAVPDPVTYNAFEPFSGSGQNLKGSSDTDDTKLARNASKIVPAALHLPPGRLFFGYPIVPVRKQSETVATDGFPGVGHRIAS